MVIGWIGGFFYHEALDEKVQYERDSCYMIMKEHLSTTNPDITRDLAGDNLTWTTTRK